MKQENHPDNSHDGICRKRIRKTRIGLRFRKLFIYSPPDLKNYFRLTGTVNPCIFSNMKLTLRATKREASDIFSFIFVPERPLRWKAGQYLHYILNHPKPDDHGVERYFSIASAPYEKQVMLTTRFPPKGGSFKKALKKLKPGDAIEAHEKGGDFVLDHRRKMFVFIAGGIGITPFRAILLDMDRKRKPLNVQLLYANRDNDFPYRKELETLKKRHPEFRIDYVVSPDRVNEKTIPKLVPDMDEPTFYVSGPEPMVESLEKNLKKLGVPK
jgi:ferredoxin-NADP reductase